MVVLCPVSRICASQSINWQKCHSKTSAFKRRSAIPAKTTGETVRQKSWSHARPRPQTARRKHVRHIETPRSTKHEANNRLYKIWPLRQKIAVGTVFVIVAKTGAHCALLLPIAILQSQGFGQHKGLQKHNTISVASSILTCNGLATQKRLASWR